MPERRQRSCSTCLGVGCLVAIVLAVMLTAAAYAVDRLVIAGPDLSEVEVSGACSVDEAQAFLDGYEDRMMATLDQLDALSVDGPYDSTSAGASRIPAYDQVDTEAMRASVVEISQTEVPECADGAIAAELEFTDFIIEVIEDAQQCQMPDAVCAGVVIWRLVRGVRPHIDRIDVAHQLVAAEAGIEPPD